VTDAWTPPRALAEFAELDHDRGARRGYPEAVLCDAKSVE
jgi:pyridinium-3,5-biscarboxylic acid mononucleotide synthase